MQNEPYLVKGPNLISVCMFCWPGEAIFRPFPDLRGVQISHGICPSCKARMLEEVKNLRRA